MKSNGILKPAVAVMALLLVAVLHQKVYLGFSEEARALKEEQASKEKTLRKYLAVLAEKPGLEAEIARLKEKVGANNAKLLPGEPISLASAGLQEMVKGFVTGRGGTVSSVGMGKTGDASKPQAVGGAPAEVGKDPLKKAAARASAAGRPEDPLERFKLIDVTLDASLPDTAALSDILYSIETRTPMLALKELDVRAKNLRSPKDLLVKMDVAGLYGGK